MRFNESTGQYFTKKFLELLVRMTYRMKYFHIATKPHEKEKIYRFRYKVYCEDLGRHVEGTDHENKMIRDDLDESENTFQFYMGDIDNPALVMRTIIWPQGQMPLKMQQDYDLVQHEWINNLNIVEFGRLMANPHIKSQFNVVLFLGSLIHHLVTQHQVGLILASCKPGLVIRYIQLGLNPYTPKLIAYPDGIEVPLAAFLDVKYSDACHSPLAPLVVNHEVAPLANLEHFFSAPSAINHDKRFILSQLNRKFCQTCQQKVSPRLISLLTKYRCYIIDINSKTKLGHQGAKKKELYYALFGHAYYFDNEHHRVKLCGFLVDDVFNAENEQYYTKDIYTKRCKVLVIRLSTINLLRRHHPDAYQELVQLIGENSLLATS